MHRPIDDFCEYVVGDALADVRDITTKKMFGGYGLYLEGNIFGIITSDSTVYFKVDQSNQARYEAMGSEPFIYHGHKNKKPTTMPYWVITEEVLEDRELLAELASESAAISARSKHKSR